MEHIKFEKFSFYVVQESNVLYTEMVSVAYCTQNINHTPPPQNLWRSWLRHCVTRRRVADSIPYGVN
jgi:hypothetical protein